MTKDERAGTMLSQALGLLQSEKLEEAAGICIAVVEEFGSWADAWYVYAVVLERKADFPGALKAALKGLSLDPARWELNVMAGRIHHRFGAFPEALEHYGKALAVDPQQVECLAGSGNILLLGGQTREALDLFRRAADVKPDEPNLLSKVIEAIDYVHDLDATEAQGARRKWNQLFAAPLKSEWKAFANTRDPERKIRVGYVSAHFNQESPARIFAPVIKAHRATPDTANGIEAVCYSDMPASAADHLTADLRAHVPLWRDTLGMTDQAFADLVRADRIDILVDLCGHAVPNRLLAFALKPAPLQVTAWGNAGGTGLEAMDYLLADRISVPEDERALFAEKILDLTCVLMVDLPDYLPPLAPLPMLKNGYVTFGCLNRAQKLDDDTLRCWAELMLSLPGSRLLIKSSGLERVDVQQRLLRSLTGNGIDPSRLSFFRMSSHKVHLETYGLVDLVLDPLSHGGALTTAEGLAMGVPAITIIGNSMMRRQSAAIQHAIGLDGFTARNRTEYMALARAWAAKPDELATLRAGLRQRMVQSPLANGPLYASEVEVQYRKIWRIWCADRGVAT